LTNHIAESVFVGSCVQRRRWR